MEEHSDGWTVLFRELNARRPLAEQVAQLRSEVVDEVRRMLESAGRVSWAGLRPPASEGVAEAIVGAGEALANWWLKKPDVPREDVADWYVGLARAAISHRGGRRRPVASRWAATTGSAPVGGDGRQRAGRRYNPRGATTLKWRRRPVTFEEPLQRRWPGRDARPGGRGAPGWRNAPAGAPR